MGRDFQSRRDRPAGRDRLVHPRDHHDRHLGHAVVRQYRPAVFFRFQKANFNQV